MGRPAKKKAEAVVDKPEAVAEKVEAKKAAPKKATPKKAEARKYSTDTTPVKITVTQAYKQLKKDAVYTVSEATAIELCDNKKVAKRV